MSGSDQSNIDTRGGDLVGVVIGGSNNRARGSKTTVQPPGTGAPVTVDQVLEQLAELEHAVQGSTLSNVLRQDTLDNVQTAREALSRDTPGVGRARHMMEGTLQELKTGGRTEAVTAVVALVTAVLEMLSRLAG
jgi:hypothetical protein